MEMTAFQRITAAFVSVAAVTAMSAAVVPAVSAAPTDTGSPTDTGAPTDTGGGGGNYYGSVANSQHLNSKGYPQLGSALNAPSQSAAESKAISDCGLSDCKKFIDFQDCVVVAWDAADKVLVGGHGSTLNAAKQAAAKQLPAGGSAKIMGQGCNKGYG